MINHKYERFRLSRIQDFSTVYNDWYFQEYFVKKYILDLPRMAYEVFGEKLTYQQLEVWEEFVKSGGWQGGRLVVPSGHGTGKTFSIGLYAIAFLLLFETSIIRIQAPTLKQVTTSSFKEISNLISRLAKRKKIDNIIINDDWYFLKNLIQVNKEKIYIKGYDTSWYIEAKTAPKGDSTNLSGQHNLAYLLIFDEASGIDDEHIETSLGGLTEDFNCCIMFSQHTSLLGKFNDFCTTLSKDNGGAWYKKILSSRYSPRVSKKQLKLMLETYTEEEIRVRIDGKPPTKDTGALLSPIEVSKIFEKSNEQIIYNTIGFSLDFGYSGYRDSSIITIYEATSTVEASINKEYIKVRVLKILKFDGTNGYQPVEFAEKIASKEILLYLDEVFNVNNTYNDIVLVGDATAGGDEAMNKIEDILLGTQKFNFSTIKKLKWGSEKLYFEDKQRFINARAKGYVYLKEAIINDRFYTSEDLYKNRVTRELSNIHYSWTSEQFKYKIMSKDEMAKKNIPSPDIADTFAQIFLLSYTASIEYNNDEIDEIYDDFEIDIVDNDKDITTPNGVEALNITTITIDDL